MVMTLISILVVFTSISSLAFRSHSLMYHFVKHTSLLLFGVGIVFGAHLIPYKYFSKLSVGLFYVSIPLLIITLFLGQNLNSANRSLLFMGLSFQTSDLAKIALIMFVARMLSRAQDNNEVRDFRNFVLPLGVKIFIICGLILPADLSTAGLLFATSMCLMFIGRVKVLHLINLVVLGVVTMAVAMILLSQVTDKVRISTWQARAERFFDKDAPVDPEKDFQSNQSKVAVATGGIFGKGPGHSSQRNILPHPYSDFIYAIIVEEYGLPGAIIVLLLYLILFYRAGVIVRRSPTHFGAFLAIGLSMSLVFQGLINMGVCVGILPVTGQPLPFVSMGGTSIMFTSIAIGAILSVSRSCQVQKKSEPEVAVETL